MFLKAKKHLSFLLVLLIFFIAIAVLSVGLLFSLNSQTAFADDTTEPTEPNDDMIYWGITQTDSTSDIFDVLILSSDSHDVEGMGSFLVGGELIPLSGSIQATSKEVPWNDIAIVYSNVKLSVVDIKSVIRPVYMIEWFSWCEYVTNLDLSNLDTSNTVDMNHLFYSLNLTTLDLSGFNTSKVTNMSDMFRSCDNLEMLDLSNFDTSSVTDMSAMFEKCRSLTTLNLSNFDMSKVTNMSEMFRSCESLEMIDLSNVDTSNITDMYGMFENCYNLTSLNLNNMDTSSVTDMNYMFSNCSSLTTLNLSSFDTHNLLQMDSLFYGCTNLSTIIGLDNFDTSKVQYMNDLFYGCSKLSNIDLSNFNTSQVHGMYEMFFGCTNLESIDLTNFDLSNVGSMSNFFQNCTSLKEIDLSKCFINGSTPMYATSMFEGCSAIEYINLSGMSIKSGTYYPIDDMLKGCDKLQEFVMPNIVSETDTFALPVVFWDGSNDIEVATSNSNGMTLLRHDTHSIEHHTYKEPTCEENGNIEYYSCTICGKYFEDELCENEIQDTNSLVLNATGHDWQEPTYTWNGKSCTAQRVCSHDGSHIESETVEASVETVVPATCTQSGQDKYTAEFVNSAFATQTTQADSSALGHEYGEWQVVKEPTFDEMGEEQRVCLHDSSHVESRQINKIFDYRWLIVIIVLSIIIVGEIIFLISHKVRANKKESK